jgi:hypothetical protein
MFYLSNSLSISVVSFITKSNVVAPSWTKWNEIKTELIGMWQVVNQVRMLNPVSV